MKEKNIVLFEDYNGVRFVLERSLRKYKGQISVHASPWKNEVINIISNNSVDLLITDLSSENPEGIEISRVARTLSPGINIIWITVLGCDVFREQRKRLGNIKCIEKPLKIEHFRQDVLEELEVTPDNP
jgi:DNA-binding NtrC family response regulator